jgi:hypothetical protein
MLLSPIESGLYKLEFTQPSCVRIGCECRLKLEEKKEIKRLKNFKVQEALLQSKEKIYATIIY